MYGMGAAFAGSEIQISFLIPFQNNSTAIIMCCAQEQGL